MNRDQAVGAILLVASAAGIVIYAWLLFFAAQWVQELVLRITGFVAVAGVLGILGWIGYTLATTPPPKPIEEIEKELEEELKKLEKEIQEEAPKEEEAKGKPDNE